MISNKIRFISMKIRLQIQTLFSSCFLSFRYKFDFGKLNAFAVRWTRMGIHSPLGSARFLSLARSPYFHLSISGFVCAYASCSFCFRSMQKSISTMQQSERMRIIQTSFGKTKRRKNFFHQNYTSSCHNNVIEFAQSKSTWENFSFKLLSSVGVYVYVHGPVKIVCHRTRLPSPPLSKLCRF